MCYMLSYTLIMSKTKWNIKSYLNKAIEICYGFFPSFKLIVSSSRCLEMGFLYVVLAPFL